MLLGEPEVNRLCLVPDNKCEDVNAKLSSSVQPYKYSVWFNIPTALRRIRLMEKGKAGDTMPTRKG